MAGDSLRRDGRKVSMAALLVTLGIVFGDLGTSPLYVMKAVMAGAGPGFNEHFVLGVLSCIFWTITLQTTVKYVFITLKADNKGEGGIFSLYALIRKRSKWAFLLAIIGGSTLLADGIITPAITVTSAIEGLHMLNPSFPVLPVVLLIITVLFSIQKFGTKKLGMVFGSSMFVWFSMLLILGLWQLAANPGVIRALNPWYAIDLLTHHPRAFLLMGAVFLATTGAEALYTDLGHCGIRNIRISWIFVKTSLIINYLGQGAWLLGKEALSGMHTAGIPETALNPFYAIMPSWFLIIGVVIATVASVIASQALISGSYSIVSEAILLNFWPKIRILYPASSKGQMYIPSINWLLYAACAGVILFFGNSGRMEAAYGLSITITMLMTTILLTRYLYLKKIPVYLTGLLLLVFVSIEGAFLVANLQKFVHGGWVTILIAGTLSIVMYIWYKGRMIKNRFLTFHRINQYKDIITDLRNDTTIPLFASNLVYLTRSDRKTDIEYKIIYSILHKSPKRAHTYWFIHVNIVDEPWRLEYSVEKIIPDVLIRVEFNIGFKVQPRVNLLFRQVTEDLQKSGEFDSTSVYPSLSRHGIPGDFRYVIIDRIQNYDFDFKPTEQLIMDLYFILKQLGISDIKAYGLDTSAVIQEFVPLQMRSVRKEMNRVE